jgi:hypothetical protein
MVATIFLAARLVGKLLGIVINFLVALLAAIGILLGSLYEALLGPPLRWMKHKVSTGTVRISGPARQKLLLTSMVAVWACWLSASVLFYQANHHFARGPMVPTGEYTDSRRDGGTGGGEINVEDVRGLDIPGWAKFFKKSEGMFLWIVLLSGAVALSKLYADSRR